MFEWFFALFNAPSEEDIFREKCQSVQNGEDIFKVVEEYRMDFKHIYNVEIGWALPARETCMHIVQFWKSYPKSTIVDLGAGSGFFCLALHHLGIPAEKLFAVDRMEPTHGQYHKLLWPIWREYHYVVPKNDILFIAWGTSGHIDVLEEFIAKGGSKVIILGEWGNDCTLASDYFRKNKAWKSTLIHVIGPASYFNEHLSMNVKI